MTFKDCFNNAELAIATEVYNANAKSPEEMAEAIRNANEKYEHLIGIINEYNNILFKLKKKAKWLSEYKEDLQNRREFANSHVATLIAEFTKNNTRQLLDEIQREIEDSGNPYGIIIIDPNKIKGELMYGSPYKKHFHVSFTDTFYLFDNFDIEEDIKKTESNISAINDEIIELLKEKQEMVVAYGSELAECVYHDDLPDFVYNDMRYDEGVYGRNDDDDDNE